MKILSKLDNTGMIEEVADKRYVTDAEKLAWNSKPDTDTVTTINGKTGAISKDDIVALGIPASALEIREMSSFLFATLITGVSVRREELDFIENENPFLLEVSFGPSSTTMFFCYWGESGENLTIAPFDRDVKGLRLFLPKDGSEGTSSSIPNDNDLLFTVFNMISDRVKTDVPEGAKFTDTTYSEITTAEIDTGTASTLRTITGRRVKYILDKVQGWISGLTKSDVGLDNVDNIKQMPISGGVLENYSEKFIVLNDNSAVIDLSLCNVFRHPLIGDTTYSITNAVSGQAHSFTLIVEQGAFTKTLTFPASVKWQGGEIPDMSTAETTYILTFMTVDGGTTWLGMFGGEF